jgi:A1 cistron-splicing factor AAR2
MIIPLVLTFKACLEHWVHIVKITFKAFRLILELPNFMVKLIKAVHTQLIYDDTAMEGSIFDHEDSLRSDLKMILTIFKSRLNEMLLGQGSSLTPEQSAVGKAFEELESWLWKWDWDLRGNYVRTGKVQLEDGEWVDAELRDFEDEDERGEWAPVVVDLDETGRETDRIQI